MGGQHLGFHMRYSPLFFIRRREFRNLLILCSIVGISLAAYAFFFERGLAAQSKDKRSSAAEIGYVYADKDLESDSELAAHEKPLPPPLRARRNVQPNAQPSSSGRDARPSRTEAPTSAPIPHLPPRTIPHGGPIISFNFDDGFRSTYEHAVPIMDAARLPATYYIITSYFGYEGYMTKEEILALQERGNEIGAHTRTHPHLDQLSANEALAEIAGSKQDLLTMGVTSVDTFSYPYGDYNDTVVSLVRSSGYSGARTSDDGLNDSSTDPMLLKFIWVTPEITFAEVKAQLDQAVTEKKWAILLFHAIDEPKRNEESVPHEFLQQIVDYVKTLGVPVVTNSEGIRAMAG